jgi:hypothetical protein
MTDLATLINQAQNTLQDLRSLDDKAGGDPGLQSKIQDATTALTSVQLGQVQADQDKIDQASKQLDEVTQATTAALSDLSKIASVVNAVAQFVTILQGIAGLAL